MSKSNSQMLNAKADEKLAYNKRHILENMRPDQVEAQRQRHLVKNQSLEQILARNERHFKDNVISQPNLFHIERYITNIKVYPRLEVQTNQVSNHLIHNNNFNTSARVIANIWSINVAVFEYIMSFMDGNDSRKFSELMGIDL